MCGQLAHAVSATTPPGRAIVAELRDDERSPYSVFREMLGESPACGFAGGAEMEVAWYELVTKRLAKKAAAA